MEKFSACGAKGFGSERNPLGIQKGGGCDLGLGGFAEHGRTYFGMPLCTFHSVKRACAAGHLGFLPEWPFGPLCDLIPDHICWTGVGVEELFLRHANVAVCACTGIGTSAVLYWDFFCGR